MFRKERTNVLVAIIIIILVNICIGLVVSRQNDYKVERTIVFSPTTVVDKRSELKDKGFGTGYEYELLLYSEQLKYAEWYIVSKYVHDKYEKGDTLNGEVIVITKTLKK